MVGHLFSLKKRLRKTRLPNGKSIGGVGRLTDKIIDSIQVYYRRAIREYNQSAQRMKSAVMPVLNHTRSTNDALTLTWAQRVKILGVASKEIF